VKLKLQPFIKNHKGLFKIGNYKSKKNYSQHRLTLDNKEDYKLISKIFDKLHNGNSFIKLEDVITFLSENPELAGVNRHHQRNEGYKRSLELDKKKIK
jgi:spore coat polysaccharide biosynthesis protein SpsF (cytidylyltransferase family)